MGGEKQKHMGTLKRKKKAAVSEGKGLFCLSASSLLFIVMLTYCPLTHSQRERERGDSLFISSFGGLSGELSWSLEVTCR